MDGKILTVANGITLFRLGLLGVFVGMVLAGQRVAAIALLVVAWGLDGVDGWVARRRREDSEVGSLVDKISDRVILGTGLLLFLLFAYVPWYAVFLASKDALLLPLLWRRREGFWGRDWSVGGGGKLVSVLQGLGLLWLALGWPGPRVVVAVVAGVGVVVGARELGRARGER